MKSSHYLASVAALVGSAGLLSAQVTWAQVSLDVLAASKKRTEQIKSFAHHLPQSTRQVLSSGAQNLIVLAERWEEVAPQLRQASKGKGTGKKFEPKARERVSDPSTDVSFSALGGFTQSETSTAWCGDTVVVGFNDTGSVFESLLAGPGGLSFDGLARSTNKGASFQDLGFLNPGANSENLLGGDPVLACTNATTFYYASIFVTLSTSNISVSKSTDGGLTFADPISAAGKDIATHFLDKPWLAADPTNANRLYVTYTNFDLSGACGLDDFGFPILRTGIELVRSADGGASWSLPVVIDEVCGLPIVQGSQVVAGSRGEVYVAWEATTADFLSREIDIRKSTNQGVTFGAKVKVSDVTPVGDGLLLQGAFRSPAEFPSLAVDRSGSSGPTNGNVYIAWHDGRNLIRDDVIPGVYRYADVLLSRSTDEGATWAAPIRVNDNIEPPQELGSDQYQPGVAVGNKKGEVGVCFYDRRDDPQNFLIGRSCARSTDAGVSWNNWQVTKKSFAAVPAQDLLIDPFYMGDYDGLDSDFTQANGGFIGAFGDNSLGNPDVKANGF